MVKRIVLLDDYQGVALDYGGWDRVPDDWQLVAIEHHIADPDELVGPALLLASEAGRYITGTTLVVDGGFLARA